MTTPSCDISTIGHSTHEIAAFMALLRRHEIRRIVDVRTVPRSRRVPQFNAEALAASLRAEGLDYTRLAELGGWRRPAKASVNDGWLNDSFRGYADHMASPEFAAGLRQLSALADQEPTAYLCAEGLWWRCHRRLISDALTVAGWHVCHILPDGSLQPHHLTPFAVVADDQITYPAPQPPG